MFSEGRRAAVGELAVVFRARQDAEVPRFAFSASRAVGGAVVRNRTKRRMRRAVGLQIARVRPGLDCVVVARSGAQELEFQKLEKIVWRILENTGLARRVGGIPGE